MRLNCCTRTVRKLLIFLLAALSHPTGSVELLRFTSPDGGAIYVNPEEVVTVRPTRNTDHFGKEVHCVMFLVDGKFIGLRETCEEVLKSSPTTLPGPKPPAGG
jgi:hypothetical protein